MRKTCTAIRHVAFEDLGTFAPPISDAGYGIRYLDAGIDDLSAARDADLAVILGGPIGVYEEEAYPFLRGELAIAEARLTSRRPMLGICLGSQLIARAAGAMVYPGTMGKEIGWKPIALTGDGHCSVAAPLGEGVAQMLHWHGDTFDLPAGAMRLASTDVYPNQVYTIGTSVLAFQCHPEIDDARIEQWLIGHANEIAATPGVDPITIRSDTRRYGPALAERSRRVITAWLKGLELTT